MTNEKLMDVIYSLYHENFCNEQIFKLLWKHKCYYLMSKNSHNLSGTDVYNQYIISRAHNCIALKERYNICGNLFSEINIPYAIIKGVPLSQTIYKDSYLRFSADVDILVSRKNLNIFKEIIEEKDFVQAKIMNGKMVPATRKETAFHTLYSHQVFPYMKETQNKLVPYVNLDVNFDVLWGESNKNIDVDFILTYVEQSCFEEITFYKLKKEMEFVCLCLHHYKDMNSLFLLSVKGLKLGQYCEIYEYIQNVKMNFNEVVYICETLDVGKYVYCCLYQTYQIFKDPILNSLMLLLNQYKDLSLCNSYGLNEKEQKRWDIPILDRIFHPNIFSYIENNLTKEEKEKIMLNVKNFM